MKTIIVYDHFIAKGGAENVSIQLSKAINGQIETAYCDEDLFKSDLDSGLLKNHGSKLESLPSTVYFLLYFLFIYKVPRHINVIFSGLFAPLALLLNKNRARSIVYFHMYPTFIDWSRGELIDKFGYFLTPFLYLAILIYKTLLSLSVKKAFKVFSNSELTKQQFAGIGIDADVLHPPVKLEGLHFEREDEFFLSTARVEESKRLPIILEAFSQLPLHNLKVVGGGSLLVQMKEKYKGCVNIEFLGWRNRDEIVPLYNKCKALIYIPQREAFGIAPVEALGSGKKVVGVDEGGLSETLNDPVHASLIKFPITIEKLKKEIIDTANSTCEQISLRQTEAAKYEESKFYAVMKECLK